jgi:hypothetical protein
VLVFAALPAFAAAVTPRPVARIDGLLASVSHGVIHIQAKGAVAGGGWKAPRLKAVKMPGNPHAIVVSFTALPPPTTAPVIQGLLPVTAALSVPMRSGIVSVRAIAGGNEITTQILK